LRHARFDVDRWESPPSRRESFNRDGMPGLLTLLYEEINSQRSEVPEMLISQVALPVSEAVQAARFYGDVLGLPTRTGGGGVEVEVGP
jgi:hypothetical protein